MSKEDKKKSNPQPQEPKEQEHKPRKIDDTINLGFNYEKPKRQQ